MTEGTVKINSGLIGFLFEFETTGPRNFQRTWAYRTFQPQVVDKSGVEVFMVEKYGDEKFGVEISCN